MLLVVLLFHFAKKEGFKNLTQREESAFHFYTNKIQRAHTKIEVCSNHNTFIKRDLSSATNGVQKQQKSKKKKPKGWRNACKCTKNQYVQSIWLKKIKTQQLKQKSYQYTDPTNAIRTKQKSHTIKLVYFEFYFIKKLIYSMHMISYIWFIHHWLYFFHWLSKSHLCHTHVMSQSKELFSRRTQSSCTASAPYLALSSIYIIHKTKTRNNI